MDETVLERFLRYVKIDTQSEEGASSIPSSAKQLDLLRLLHEELLALGLKSELTDFGIVVAHLESNSETKVPAVGFIAHVDTSPEASGTNVSPLVMTYLGGDVTLENGSVIPESSELRRFVDKKIVTTDGKTLLGADDKAGVAEIMDALNYLVKNPSIKHGRVCVAFTPDEEIGGGLAHFDLQSFGAEVAYTIDGGGLGEISDRNFNAATAKFDIKGITIHPGEAKDKMVSAVLIARDILNQIPDIMTPAETSGSEGYLHVTSMNGTPAEAEITVLIREFDEERFDLLKRFLQKVRDSCSKRWRLDEKPDAKITLSIRPSYRNMFEGVRKRPLVMDLLRKSLESLGIPVRLEWTRGGTDGCRLTEMGLPTPNIFSGACNMHSTREWVAVEALEKASQVIVSLVQMWHEGK